MYCYEDRVTFHEKITKYVKMLQRHADRWWYAPLIGLLAAADNLIVVVPTDGILVSSSMLRPGRWAWFAFSIAVGSTVGAIVLAGLVEFHGLPWILNYFPGIDQTNMWQWTEKFFDEYGLIVVFAVAATPLMQQPTLILASLANTPLFKLAVVVFVGRFIKFLVMAYIGSHAPKLLGRLWGIKGDLKDAGVEIKS